MKYKVLLTGKNAIMIDDFFAHLDERIEIMTTSFRWEDMLSHIKYFEPDVFCYCAGNEVEDHISQMVSLKNTLEKKNVILVVVGSAENCAEFDKKARGIADYMLQKPIKASAIQEAVIKYVDEKRKEEQRIIEEQKRVEEQMLREEQERMQEQMLMEEGKKASGKRKHILVIDDDPGMLKVIKEQLHDRYEVATALNGGTALKFLEKKTTDLILLDYEMPEENGVEVLKKLRARKNTKNLPVLFLTGVADQEKIAQVIPLKPQGYLLKPIEHDKLVAAIARVLGE